MNASLQRLQKFLGIETDKTVAEPSVTVNEDVDLYDAHNFGGLVHPGDSDDSGGAEQGFEFDDEYLSPIDPDRFDDGDDEIVEFIVIDNLSEVFRRATQSLRAFHSLLDPPDEPKTYNGPRAYYPHYPSIILRDAFTEKDFGRILWVARQDRIWVDAWGHMHDLDKMPVDYKLNILSLLHEWVGQGVLPMNPYDCPLIQRLRADLLGDD